MNLRTRTEYTLQSNAKKNCALDGTDWKKISLLNDHIFSNSGLTIFLFTNKHYFEQLQRVETSSFEQEEVLETIEKELFKNCRKWKKIGHNFTTESKELCRPKVNDQFAEFRDNLQSNQNVDKAVSNCLSKQDADKVQDTEYREKFLDNFIFT